MNKSILYKIAYVLIDVVKKKEKITYSQLSERLDRKVKPINLGNLVGELSEISYSLELPLISVVVVNKKSKIPGDGYFRLCSELKKINEIDAMNDLEKEINRVYACNKWNKLLSHLGNEFNNTAKKDMNNITYWLAVHKQRSYNENSRLLGFKETTYNAKNIKPNDIVVYYFSGLSILKGIYEVSETPWMREPRWTSKYQIGIKPIIETEVA